MGTRVQLGKLPNGDYGLKVTDAAGNALIDGSKVQLAQSTGRLPSGVEFGLAQTKVTADGLVANDGIRDRVIVGKISTAPDYGLKVVNVGATVIIDGTSNMFKIAATGTMSNTIAVDSAAETTVTLTALGALPTTPAHLSFISDANNTAAQQFIGMAIRRDTLFAASTSGGSPTSDFQGIKQLMRVRTSLDGSSQCVVGFGGDNRSDVEITWFARYYVLQETAL